MKIAIIGGGIIGRTAAYVLQGAGHTVTVITDQKPEDTTSSIAGGLWKPAHAEPRERLIKWANETYDWFQSLPNQAASDNGLQWIPSMLHQTSFDNNLDWANHVADLRPVVTPAGLPSEITGTYKATLPIADMSRFLPWLITQSNFIGVKEVFRTILDVEEARAYGELVVIATGLATNTLIPDAGLYPIQGQIVRVQNPGNVGYHKFNTAETTLYVIPRVDDVVIGGTHVKHESSLQIDSKLQQTMLSRAIQFEPRLAGQDILSAITGLRPGRAEVRVERVGNTIHAYGHGGSGVTVCWGVGQEILKLVDTKVLS